MPLLRSIKRAFARDSRGTVAVEFALVVGALIVVLLNSIDVAKYYFQRMEMQNATQMAAQAVWEKCDTTKLPATTNCSGMSSAISTALQSTSLGTAVSQKTGSPSEGYYCVNLSGALTYVANINSKPANCSSVGSASDTPGLYVKIDTQYTFTPMFGNMGVGAMLPSSVTSTAMMRLQ
jgi:Flp pilus assembly protein TadG